MRLFDTHAHYDDEQFDQDREELLNSMAQAGVELIVNPGCDLETSTKSVEIANRFPFVYSAVGFHPEEAGKWDEHSADALRQLAKDPKVKAIGEIGLDYYWEENPPREVQHKVFHAQLDLAEELDLPVIIHDREAHGDCMDIIRQHPNVKGVFHCYSSSLEYAKTLVKMGWMLSFNGVITFKNARKPVEVVEWIPMEHLMLETDSPYLSPVPFRGKRNSSLNVHLVAEKVAEIKGMDPDEVARICLENGKRFYRIDQ